MKRIVQMAVLFVLFAGSGYYAKAAELKPISGPIGKITITKPINLWESKSGRLSFIRTLKPGDTYRVYGYEPQQNQYRVGRNMVITNIPGRIKYETLFVKKYPEEASFLVEAIVEEPAALTKHPEVLAIKKRISNLPITLLDKMRKQKVSILLTDQPITSLAPFSYLKGQTPRGWEQTNKTWDDIPGIGGSDKIGIRIGFSEYGKGHGSVNLELHETAHSIDHLVYQELSAKTVFHEIWKKEKAKLFGTIPYYRNYPEEYFAEAFSMYYLSNKTRLELEQKAPLTHTFFENLP